LSAARPGNVRNEGTKREISVRQGRKKGIRSECLVVKAKLINVDKTKYIIKPTWYAGGAVQVRNDKVQVMIDRSECD
jgi:hypothetical protein